MIMSPAGMIRRWCGGIRRAFGPVNLDDAERIREYAVELDQSAVGSHDRADRPDQIKAILKNKKIGAIPRNIWIAPISYIAVIVFIKNAVRVFKMRFSLLLHELIARYDIVLLL